MAYVGSVYGPYTARDAEGDRMRWRVDFHSTNYPYTPGMTTTAIEAVYYMEFDLGVGDAIIDSTYNVNMGGSWGTSTSGTGINGSADSNGVYTKEMRRTHQVIYSPAFGSGYIVNVTGSISNIDKVGNSGNPFTATMNENFTFPAKPYSGPNKPTTSASFNAANSQITMNISGHQTNASQDKYWQVIDVSIYRSNTGSWHETLAQLNTITSFTWDVVPDGEFLIGARARHANGDSGWTPWLERHSKPSAPTNATATRPNVDKTQVVINWTNNAPYATKFYVFRWNGTGWVQIAQTTATTFTDTQPLGATSWYTVMAGTNDSVYSDQTPNFYAPSGYSAPAAPTNVLLSLNAGGDTATVTFSGHQTNPAVDRYWEDVARRLDTNGVLGVETVDPNGDAASFTFLGLVGNSRYRARVHAKNGAGAGAAAFSNYVYTKPLAATNVVVARDGISEAVSGSFTSNAAYAGSHLVHRFVDGGPSTLVATLPAATTTFTDSVPLTATATYTVTTRSPVPITQADLSAVSNTIPFVGYDKDGIPGVDDIFVGTDKVYKVMAGTNQIWLG